MSKDISKQTEISFEFFPAKAEKSIKSLCDTAKKLIICNPSFFSVTYGAFGGSQNHTITTVQAIKKTTGINIAPHLTCIGSKKAEIEKLLIDYKKQNINHLVILRGDLPPNMQDPGEFKYAVELVAFIREHFGDYFYIDVAAYPEAHPQSYHAKMEMQYFKQKTAAGANAAITQFLYNTAAYEDFLQDCKAEGITIPIVPGIMPIYNAEQLERFSDACGAEVPRWLRKKMLGLNDNLNDLQRFGVDVVTKLCEQLIAAGAPGIHIYTLNKADIPLQICENLGLLETKKAQVRA